MKTSKKQTQPESKEQKRDYVKPEIKKRERIKEITEFPTQQTTLVPD